MKYKISTDEAIIKHISAFKAGECILHACVGNSQLHPVEGVVTSCNSQKRMVTLQMRDGSKSSYTFDLISIPDTHQG